MANIGPSIVNMVLAGFNFTTSLSLAKPLDYIPKSSHQGLLPYLATSLCLTKTPRSSNQNSLFDYNWLTCPTHASTDFPFVPLKTAPAEPPLLSLPQPEAAPCLSLPGK